MSIGANVQRLREQRSMNQDELAAAVRVHQTYISKIELGKKEPSIDVARRLAECLGVSLSELFAESQPEPV